MSVKKRKAAQSNRRPPKRNHSAQGFYTPFEHLDQHLARKSTPDAPTNQHEENYEAVPQVAEEETIFLDAMSQHAA